MNRVLAIVLFGALITSGILFSCRGGGNSGVVPATGSLGTVALYLSDDLSSLFSQVTATINRVQLVNTGMGASCDVLTAPVSINIANLANVLQLVAVTQCVPGSFNRFRVQFDKNTHLVSSSTGTGSACSFVSFKNEGSGNQPDVLQCDQKTNICTIDVNGAVNVLAVQNNKLALDFDLRNFEVKDLDTQNCAVTMKVSPLAMGQMQAVSAEALTGIVSRLDIVNKMFDLTRGNRTFSVLYSGITASAQPGLDSLLARAQDDGLRTRVTTSVIDLGSNRIIASRVGVKVEGTVSDLVTDTTFTVNYGTGGAKTIGVDFSNADVSGILENGSWVDVKLNGQDQAEKAFLADSVEVELPGTMTED